MPDGVILPRTGSFPLVDAVEIAEIWRDQTQDEAAHEVVVPALGTDDPATYSCLRCRNSWLTFGVYAHVLCWTPNHCCHFGDLCMSVNP